MRTAASYRGILYTRGLCQRTLPYFPLLKDQTKAKLTALEKEIAEVNEDIKKTEERLNKAIEEEGNPAMILYLQNKEIQLRVKENKLRDQMKSPQEKQPGGWFPMEGNAWLHP